MRIIVVEDEPAIARIVSNGLQRCGHVVDVIEDGAQAIKWLDIYDYDVAILDIMLPGADGFDICRHIRNLGLDTRVIMLTAKDDIDSKVSSLNMGADDYMTKPFSIEELAARVRALSRREKLIHKTTLKTDVITLDMASKKVLVNNKPLNISDVEFRLLEYMIRHRNTICSKTMLEENIWGNKYHTSNVITVTISKLRSKIRKLNGNKNIIHTISKSGYIIY